MASLFIEYPPISWNKIITSHWRVYKRLKDELAQATALSLMVNPIKLTRASKYVVTVTAFHGNNRRHDTDNLFIKSILDIFVKRGLIPDDDSKTIAEVRLKVGEQSGKKKRIGYLVEVEPME